MTQISTGDPLREKVEAIKSQPESKRIPLANKVLTREEKRGLGEDNFRFFLNLLSYNWMSGSPDEWYRVPAYAASPHPDEDQDWHSLLHESQDSHIILAGRKHTKSVWALGEIAHQAEYTNRSDILYYANSQRQVSARMGELEDMIEENLWLSNLHKNGNAPGGNSKEFPNGSKIHTVSMGGAIEGSHVHLSIGDDIIKETGGINDSMDWYRRVIVPMRNQSGRDTIVGTRKHPNDIYEQFRTMGAEMEGIPTYKLSEYPAVREPWIQEYSDRKDDIAPDRFYTSVEASDLRSRVTSPGDNLNVLWPQARGPEFLRGMYGRQGRPAFLREFCMVYIQAENSIVDREWIQVSDQKTPQNINQWQPSGHNEPVSRDWWDQVVTGIDPAGKGNDCFSFVTVGKHNRLRHVLDVTVEQDMTPSEFRQEFSSLYQRYRPDEMVMEGNALQSWYAEDEEFEDHLPISSSTTTEKKHSLTDGIPKIASDLEMGLYKFYESEGTDELITGLTSLQVDGDGLLKDHTADTVMALYQTHKKFGSSLTSSSIDMSESEEESGLDPDSAIGGALQGINRQRRRNL